MKKGDFTTLAKEYGNRPGYSNLVLENIIRHAGLDRINAAIADVGAGTGKLHEVLLDIGCKDIVAVEPNDSMRSEGIVATAHRGISWKDGTGEETGLADSSKDWVLMASSFHWTDPAVSLPEFYRILKPNGFLTVLWNPRDLDACPLQRKINKFIEEKIPSLSRVSSGGRQYTTDIESTLESSGHFRDVIQVEAKHTVTMTPERYLGAWRSVNDIQAQAGSVLFEEIISCIQDMISDREEIIMPYRTRSWTTRVFKK